ncbi:MAG: transposase [Clostridiaceae bacterium]|nr:transposase [Clostridiaceae bacterium]
MASNHERNTEGLIKSREKKAKECQERVDKAIRELLKEKGKITFNSVSERANVSKKYLYDNHFDRIDTLRKQQEWLSSPKQVKREMTDASKDVIIASKNKRIKELEAEVKRLKGILERRYGEDYDKGI